MLDLSCIHHCSVVDILTMSGLYGMPGGREVQAGQRRRQQQHDHAGHHQGEDH